MGRAWLLVVIGGALCALGMPAAASANSCTYDAATGTVHGVLDQFGTASVYVDFDSTIHVYPVGACGAATSSNTDAVEIVLEPTGGGVFQVDLNGLPFAPGRTPEASGLSEIELSIVDRRTSKQHEIDFRGGPGDDFISLGKNGVALNRDDDVDVTITSTRNVLPFLDGGDGDDTLLGTGGFGAGKPWKKRLAESGRDGNDTLIGGDGPDQIIGYGTKSCSAAGDDDDYIDGGRGADYLQGDGGDDTILGGRGDDVIFGDLAGIGPCAGNDTIDGGPGRDTINAQDGDDTIEAFDTMLDQVIGGGGVDVARVDCALDVVTEVETTTCG